MNKNSGDSSQLTPTGKLPTGKFERYMVGIMRLRKQIEMETALMANLIRSCSSLILTKSPAAVDEDLQPYTKGNQAEEEAQFKRKGSLHKSITH